MHFPIIEPMFSNTGNPEAQPPSLADIVREETEDGRLIVRFLIDVMQGLLEQSKPCHQLDAARQLLNLGFLQAQTFIDTNTHASSPQKKLRALRVLGVETTPLQQELAALIREETDNGRTTVRFLTDVMQGNLPDFKPHHRLSAAKELLRRGFDTPVPSDAGNSAEETPAPAEKRPPAPRSWTHILNGRYAGYPAGYSRYETEYGPFDFRSYDDEEYHFDTQGSAALEHISGGKEAASAVHKTLYDFRYDARQLAKATGQDHNGCDHLIKFPDDCPQPENIYGYKALLRKFGTEQAARVAAWAAAQYHRKQAALAAGLLPEVPETPARPPPPDTIWDQPAEEAEELYPEDRPPPDPEPDAPDAPKLTMLEEYLIHRRQERARNDRNNWDDDPPGLTYDRFTIPIIP